MTQVAPAFWVRYRGKVDPANLPLNTAYNYSAIFYKAGGTQLAPTIAFGVLGPPQLSKQNYMEIKWSPAVGLVRISISRNAQQFYDSSGAEQGFRDEGQYTSISGGVTNQ